MEQKMIQKIDRFVDKIESTLNNLFTEGKKSPKEKERNLLRIAYEPSKERGSPLNAEGEKALFAIPQKNVDFRNSVFLN
jgi:hypothetical protein